MSTNGKSRYAVRRENLYLLTTDTDTKSDVKNDPGQIGVCSILSVSNIIYMTDTPLQSVVIIFTTLKPYRRHCRSYERNNNNIVFNIFSTQFCCLKAG